jgi:hypothetical protein
MQMLFRIWNHSRLSKEAGCDISHVCFFELVILTVVPVDANKVESFNHSVNLKPHIDKAVNEVLIVPLIPIEL